MRARIVSKTCSSWAHHTALTFAAAAGSSSGANRHQRCTALWNARQVHALVRVQTAAECFTYNLLKPFTDEFPRAYKHKLDDLLEDPETFFEISRVSTGRVACAWASVLRCSACNCKCVQRMMRAI